MPRWSEERSLIAVKKFIALVVVLCAVMISSSASAELAPVQLYDQNVFTLTQKLQSAGFKIWNMKYRTTKYYPGYEANFGDNPNNKMAFLVNNDGSVSALGIITRFENFDYPVYPTMQQAFELAGATLFIVGLTLEDVKKIGEEIEAHTLNTFMLNPRATKYDKEFSSYSVRTRRLIIVAISAEEISPNVGELRIFVYARA